MALTLELIELSKKYPNQKFNIKFPPGSPLAADTEIKEKLNEQTVGPVAMAKRVIIS
jgi:hypothetical protein